MSIHRYRGSSEPHPNVICGFCAKEFPRREIDSHMKECQKDYLTPEQIAVNEEFLRQRSSPENKARRIAAAQAGFARREALYGKKR